jgi:hypothetical protein
VLLAVALADGHEAAPVVSLVVHLVDQDGDADDPPGEWKVGGVLEGLPERPELLVWPVRVDGHFLDEVIDGVNELLMTGSSV